MIRESSPTPTSERPDIDTYTYTEGTEPYNFSYRYQSFCISPNGNHFYISGGENVDQGYSYLGTATSMKPTPINTYNLSNAQFDAPFFKDRNTIYYIYNSSVYKLTMDEYSLANAYATSETLPSNYTYFVSGTFNRDGTKLYTIDDYFVGVQEYELSTPRDVSTGVLNVVGTVYKSGAYIPYTLLLYDSSDRRYKRWMRMKFSPTGRKIWVIGSVYDYDYDEIYQYSCSTPRDITTATYDNKYLALDGSRPEGTRDFDVSAENRLFLRQIVGTSNYILQYDSH